MSIIGRTNTVDFALVGLISQNIYALTGVFGAFSITFNILGIEPLGTEVPRFLGCTSPYEEVSEHRLTGSFRPLAICERLPARSAMPTY